MSAFGCRAGDLKCTALAACANLTYKKGTPFFNLRVFTSSLLYMNFVLAVLNVDHVTSVCMAFEDCL